MFKSRQIKQIKATNEKKIPQMKSEIMIITERWRRRGEAGAATFGSEDSGSSKRETTLKCGNKSDCMSELCSYAAQCMTFTFSDTHIVAAVTCLFGLIGGQVIHLNKQYFVP